MPGHAAMRALARVTAPAVAAAALALAGGPPPAAGQTMRVREHVEVRRAVVDVRVVDRRGDPVTGLAAAEFRALVDGAPVPVESAEWVSGAVPFAEGLTPEQAAAVVSFDSRLELRLDFTNDRDKIAAAIHQAILPGSEPSLAAGPFPSLAASFDAAAATRAASPEAGLLVTARALEKLPGAKSLVFFGWGLGIKVGPRIWLGRSYDLAREALLQARVSVFAIDVTDADAHDLEVGLQQIAADTGGFYAKTNLFPGQAITRLEGALAGHYVLVLVCPEKPRGVHTLTIELPGRAATVLAKPTFQD